MGTWLGHRLVRRFCFGRGEVGNVDWSLVTDGSYVVIFILYVQCTSLNSRGPVHATEVVLVAHNEETGLNAFYCFGFGFEWDKWY